jgi:hypothetical protein
MNISKKNLFNLTILFIISRIIFYMFGVRFDANTLHYLQVLDTDLLKTRLLESLWHLHSQPPLFNLALGLGLKMFPHSYPLVFNAVYLVMGYGLVLAMFLLMKKLGVGSTLSFFLTCLFMVNPAVILYENWLFYSYPVAVLLCLSALFLHRYVQCGRTWDLTGFFSCGALLVLVRSLFHVFWFLGGMLVLLCFRKERRKQIVLTGLIPVLILNGVYLKNYLISGNYTTSSTWFGWTLAGMTIPFVYEDEFKQIRKDGGISFVTDEEFGDPMDIGKVYARHYPVPETGVPVLDRRMKADGRTPNYNSLLSLQTSRLYLKDGLYVLTRYPQAYARAVKRAFFVYFFPGPTDIRMVNRPAIRAYENAYNFMFARLTRINSQDINWYSSVFYPVRWDFLSLILFFSVVEYYLVLFFFLGWALFKAFQREPFDQAFALTLLYMTVNILYITLLINAFEPVGNNRYRFTIDPFFWITSGLLLAHYKDRLFKKKKKEGPEVLS